MSGFSVGNAPKQTGKLAVVTGGNSGIGFFTGLGLARTGAKVILACRDVKKGTGAAAAINKEVPGGRVTFEQLDLASLQSVRDFAGRLKARAGSLDILINNAGLMALPKRQVTADGFEMQLGVNFLGHFALTALLLPVLMKAPSPRVVQLSSIAHRQGKINFADLQYAQGYKPWKVYNQSKLAMLMFALELQRRSDSGGWGLTSVAAHPGIAKTELVANGPGERGPMGLALKLFGGLITHSAAAGALPTLLAATSTQVTPGGYYGPLGFMEFKGPPGVAKISPQALDLQAAARLWETAALLTGPGLGIGER